MLPLPAVLGSLSCTRHPRFSYLPEPLINRQLPTTKSRKPHPSTCLSVLPLKAMILPTLLLVMSVPCLWFMYAITQPTPIVSILSPVRPHLVLTSVTLLRLTVAAVQCLQSRPFSTVHRAFPLCISPFLSLPSLPPCPRAPLYTRVALTPLANYPPPPPPRLPPPLPCPLQRIPLGPTYSS